MSELASRRFARCNACGHTLGGVALTSASCRFGSTISSRECARPAAPPSGRVPILRRVEDFRVSCPTFKKQLKTWGSG